MGRDKAWLEIGDEHLLQRIVRVGLDAVPRVIVVAAPGQRLPRLPTGVHRIDDPPARAGGGPLAGVLTGLEALAHDSVELAYVGSVDTVRLTTAHICFMLERLDTEAGRTGVVPCAQDGARRLVHGLCGALRVSVAAVAAGELLHAGERSMRALYARIGAEHLDTAQLPEPRVVEPCNTPEQWYDACAELSLHSVGDP